MSQHAEHARKACKNLRKTYSHVFTPLVFPSPADNVRAGMNKTVIEVQVRAVLPTSGGGAAFVGYKDKDFIIYIEQTVSGALTMYMRDITKQRAVTHDYMKHPTTAPRAQ